MNIEKQVCTLEQANKLKELGVIGSPAFIHCRFLDDVDLSSGEKKYRWDIVFTNWHPDAFGQYITFPAYTVAELGVMLPFYLVNIGELTVKKNYRRELMTGWNTRYEKTVNCTGNPLPVCCADNMAESMCLMLIYLLENGLTTAEEVNNRLTTNA